MSATGASISAAHRLLQRRALQCSFTSVFHLRQAGVMATREAEQVERLFLISAGLPLLVLLVSGLTVKTLRDLEPMSDTAKVSVNQPAEP